MRTFLIITIVCLFSCRKSDEYYTEEIFNSQNLKIYGRWLLVQPSEINKKSFKYEDQYFIYCDKLEINPIGHYIMYDDNKIRESGYIKIRKQTIDSLTIRFFPDERYQNNFLPNEHNIEFAGDDTLKLDYVNSNQALGFFKRLK